MKAVCILGSPRSNGSTATLLATVMDTLKASSVDMTLFRLGEMRIAYCTGCRSCDINGSCVQRDDMGKIIPAIFDSNIIIVASPSYWGDVTGQMKTFIDRCLPYCNTNPNRLQIPEGKTGAAIAVRSGQSSGENDNLIATMRHFLGHMDIPLKHTLTVEGVSSEQDLVDKPALLARAISFGNEIVSGLSASLE